MGHALLIRASEAGWTIALRGNKEVKVRAMADYFRHADAADAAWAVWFLSGHRPKRLIPARRLATWAMEIADEVILKATRVDGVYSADPVKHKDAVKYATLTYLDVLKMGLQVMDATATSLCMDNNLPIVVFDLTRRGNIKRVVLGEPIGTIVKGE